MDKEKHSILNKQKMCSGPEFLQVVMEYDSAEQTFQC